MNRTLLGLICAAVISSCGTARGATSYKEQFGISMVGQDLPTRFNGQLSPFFSYEYIVSSFDEGNTNSSTVYVNGDTLERVGRRFTTLLDLNSETFTILDSYERVYTTLSIPEFGQRLMRTPFKKREMGVQLADANVHTLAAILFSGRKLPLNITAHAELHLAGLPGSEIQAFETRCAQKYAPKWAGVCALTDPRGFGVLSSVAPIPDRWVEEEVMDWRNLGPTAFGMRPAGPDSEGGRRTQETTFDNPNAPWNVDAGPGMGYILRAKSRLSEVSNESVSAPAVTLSGLKRVKDLPLYWKNQD